MENLNQVTQNLTSQENNNGQNIEKKIQNGNKRI